MPKPIRPTIGLPPTCWPWTAWPARLSCEAFTHRAPKVDRDRSLTVAAPIGVARVTIGAARVSKRSRDLSLNDLLRSLTVAAPIAVARVTIEAPRVTIEAARVTIGAARVS